MNPSERLKNLIEKNDYSYEELGRLTGISKSALQRYASGNTKKIPLDAIKKVADVFGENPAYLMGWVDDLQPTPEIQNIYHISTRKFPLLGTIACGEPLFVDENNIELYVEAGTNINADFCLRCQGDSMINARIHDGDIVFIRQQPTVNNGEIAAVVIDNEATLKRVTYFKDKDTIILKAENPQFQDLIYTGSELESIRIVGKAVAFQSDIK